MASNRGLTGVCVALVLTILGACGGGGDKSAGGGSTGGTGTPPSNNSPNVPPSNNDPNAPVAVGAFAYVANQSSDDISAYSIDESTGALSEVPGSPFAAGDAPRHIVVTPSGRFAYVGNTSTNLGRPFPNTVLGYAIDATTGVLTRVGDPVELGGVPTSIAMHPSGRAFFVAVRGELPGDTHYVSGYAIDAATGLVASIGSTQTEAEPRNIAIDPAGRFAYVSVNDSSAGSFYISTYAIDSTNGALSESTPRFATRGPVDRFAVAPSGRFAYASDFDAVDLAVMVGYSIDATTGALSEIAGSPFSQSDRVFIHPSGRFVYGGGPGSDPSNWDSVTFAVDESTGVLTKVGATSVGEVGIRLAFSPSGTFVYGTNTNVQVNTPDPDTGVLVNIGSVRAGSFPDAIAVATTFQ